MNSIARASILDLRTRQHIALLIGLLTGLAMALATPGLGQDDTGDDAAARGQGAKTETQPSAGRSHPPQAPAGASAPVDDAHESGTQQGKPPSRAGTDAGASARATDRSGARSRPDRPGGVDTRTETAGRPAGAGSDTEAGADSQSPGTAPGDAGEDAATRAADAEPGGAPAESAPSGERIERPARPSPSDGDASSATSASRARRERSSERAATSISAPLAQLRAESTATEKMSRDQQLALLEQIAQASLVELSAMRDELAAAQLEAERLQRLLEDLARDRKDIPPAVSTGRIPTFGAKERWNRLSETVEELEIGIDETFGVRVQLLGMIPGLKRDLEAARALSRVPKMGTDAALLELLRDAADKLQQRVEMSEKLVEAYRQQTAVAVDAYDVASRYSAELSQAIVDGRRRGLQARVPGPLSPATLAGLLEDLGMLTELPAALIETYRLEGRAPPTGVAAALRATAALLLIWIAVYAWRRAPDWAYRLAEMHFGGGQTDDN